MKKNCIFLYSYRLRDVVDKDKEGKYISERNGSF